VGGTGISMGNEVVHSLVQPPCYPTLQPATASETNLHKKGSSGRRSSQEGRNGAVNGSI